ALQRYDDLGAVTIAYAPFAQDKTIRLAAPVAWRDGKQVSTGRLEDDYDYTQADWYTQAMAEGEAWGTVRLDPKLGERVIDYALKVAWSGPGALFQDVLP